MPLTMNREVFITCAVTGSGGTQDRSPHVPRSPKQIADSAIEAARAGAAVVHCHVRDPETGTPSRRLEYYREVTDRIRDAEVDVVLNLTAGMGGDMVFGPTSAPLPLQEGGTDMIGAEERVAHVAECLPEICTLDCGTMNFGNGNEIYISTPPYLRQMAGIVQELGVKPELEVFELGHIRFAKQMIAEGLINEPPMFQICMGIPWGADQSVDTMKVMKDELPANASWASFGISRMQMPMAAAAVAMGGNVRVGLEDNIYLDKGVLATNAQLVERAREIIERMGARVLTAEEARQKLGLIKQS